MRDARIPLLPLVTKIADATFYSNEVNLLEDYVKGSHFEAVNEYGVGVEVIASNVVTGTGDGFTVTVTPMVAPDNAGVAGTYVDLLPLGVFTIDTDGHFVGPGSQDMADLLVTRAKLSGRVAPNVKTQHWFKLKFVISGITNNETIDLQAWFADGALPYQGHGSEVFE